jgi:hypothetical protein
VRFDGLLPGGISAAARACLTGKGWTPHGVDEWTARQRETMLRSLRCGRAARRTTRASPTPPLEDGGLAADRGGTMIKFDLVIVFNIKIRPFSAQKCRREAPVEKLRGRTDTISVALLRAREDQLRILQLELG